MGLLDAILKQAAASGDLGGARGVQAGGIGRDRRSRHEEPADHRGRDRDAQPEGPVGGRRRRARRRDRAPSTRAGSATMMASWVSGGPNKPVDPGALANVLGPDVLQPVRAPGGHRARRRQLGPRLVLPELVNHMTPQGKVPQGHASRARSARCSASSAPLDGSCASDSPSRRGAAESARIGGMSSRPAPEPERPLQEIGLPRVPRVDRGRRHPRALHPHLRRPGLQDPDGLDGAQPADRRPPARQQAGLLALPRAARGHPLRQEADPSAATWSSSSSRRIPRATSSSA